MKNVITDIYGNTVNDDYEDEDNGNVERSSKLIDFSVPKKGKKKRKKHKKRKSAKRYKKIKERLMNLERKCVKHEASISEIASDTKAAHEAVAALKKTVLKIGRSKLLADLDTMINADSLSERREAAARFKSGWGDFNGQ